MGILINRIQGPCPLISSLQGSALITHVESLGLLGLAMSTSVLKALPGKRHSPGILLLGVTWYKIIKRVGIQHMYKLACAYSRDSNQSVHPCSMIRV